MIPLLRDRVDNPRATLITLFMNAVDENMTDEDQLRDMMPQSQSTRQLLRYLPPDGSRASSFDPKIIKFNLARDIVTDYEVILKK